MQYRLIILHRFGPVSGDQHNGSLTISLEPLIPTTTKPATQPDSTTFTLAVDDTNTVAEEATTISLFPYSVEERSGEEKISSEDILETSPNSQTGLVAALAVLLPAALVLGAVMLLFWRKRSDRLTDGLAMQVVFVEQDYS